MLNLDGAFPVQNGKAVVKGLIISMDKPSMDAAAGECRAVRYRVDGRICMTKVLFGR